MGRQVLAALIVSLLFATSGFSMKIQELGQALNASGVAQVLTGPGVTLTNVKITGANAALGLFSEAGTDGLGIASGIVLSSGNVKDAVGPNDQEAKTGNLSQPGAAILDALITPNTTRDAVILEFDAVTVSNSFAIRYVFASEEYKEYVGSQFNDVFAFFVNGKNIANGPAGKPVAINTINHNNNAALYRDNPPGSNKANIQFDGYTAVLTATATVTAGVPNKIRIAIADTSDPILDSAVFIARGGISGVDAPVLLPTPSEVVVPVGETANINVDIFNLKPGAGYSLSASGLPQGSSVSFSPITLNQEGVPHSSMAVMLAEDAAPDTYLLLVKGTLHEFSVDSFATVRIIGDCTPPLILGSEQPRSQRVTRGGAAVLRVGQTSGGRYQSFRGYAPLVGNPIPGATSAAFTTPAVTEPIPYWVRITNACGSADSTTALISPSN